MPARKIELQEAIEDGVNPEFKTRVIKAEGKERKIEKRWNAWKKKKK